MADSNAVTQADAAQAANNFTEVISILEKAVQSNSDNVEILWRLARAYYQLSQESDDKAKQKELLDKGLEYAKQAAKADENHYGGHKWCGIILGAIGDHTTTKEKISNAFTIKEFFLRAEKTAPADATVQHALGKWCFAVANVGWVERQAASLLFASPPTSTHEESLAYIVKCHELATKNPMFAGVMTQNCLLMAQNYEALKKMPEAKEWYQKCIDNGGPTKPEMDAVAVAKQKLPLLSSGGWW